MLSKWPTAATNLLPARALPHALASYGLCALSSLAGGRCPCGAGSASTGAFKRSSKAVVASCMLSFVPTAWRAGRKSQRWGRSRILSYFVRLVTATRGPLPADARHVSSPWVLHNAATPPRTRRVFYATSHRSILAQDRAEGGQAQAGRVGIARFAATRAQRRLRRGRRSHRSRPTSGSAPNSNLRPSECCAAPVDDRHRLRAHAAHMGTGGVDRGETHERNDEGPIKADAAP